VKKKLSHIMSIVLSLGLIVAGGVTAYFTHQASTQQIVVSTGSLAIEIGETNPIRFDNLLPGQEQEITWTVSNTGSTPVALKGKIEGNWEDQNLLGADLKMIDVSAQIDGSWLSLASDLADPGSEFFLSATGQENDLMNLAAGEIIPMRLKFILDSQVLDDYQNQNYGLSVHLAAKQTNSEANWPSSY